MSAVEKNVKKIKGHRVDKSAVAKRERLACSVEELRRLIGVSRNAAYKLGRKLGRRVGGKRGRLVVPLAKVHAWLAGEVQS